MKPVTPFKDPAQQRVLKDMQAGIDHWRSVRGMVVSYTEVNQPMYRVKADDCILGVTYTTRGAVKIQLPRGVGQAGMILAIKDEGNNAATNNITIETMDTVEIDSVNMVIMNINSDSIYVYCNNEGNWFVI